MAEMVDFKRIEDQIYQYYPELKRESEDIKAERRQQLFMQLRSSKPVVQLSALDPVTSLTNIKDLLEKCKDCVQDPLAIFPEMVASPSVSLLESSGDEFLGTQQRRRAPRKRKSSSALVRRSEIEESRNELKEQDSPLSLSILIPQVVKGSDKMEISIDLGGLDASQRLFGSRVEGLLRNCSNNSNMLEDVPATESSCSSNRNMNSQMRVEVSNAIENVHECNDTQEDDMLSNLLSQVLVDSNPAETLQATNVLDNINNNESSNYATTFSVKLDGSEEPPTKKKRQRKQKKTLVEKGPPKKRGRKPKNKEDINNVEMPKSDLAKYVELFSNTCNVVGSATPTPSSTISQQLVTSTTHYLEPSEHQPITYYLEGNWENGGSCQLIQAESTQIDSGQDEFNMAELVNYIDNVGDTANVIARVLDGSSTLPILVQDSHTQINSAMPPPAHISDVLLDLSKKSTIVADVCNISVEPDNQDILPLDLSFKASNLNRSSVNVDLDPMESVVSSKNLERITDVFDNHNYDSFAVGLDMPLIDIDDNINAFMELTNSQVIKTATEKDSNPVACDSSIEENIDNTLPVYNFELSGMLSENTLNKKKSKIAIESDSQIAAVKTDALKNDADTNSVEQGQNVKEVLSEMSKIVKNRQQTPCNNVDVLNDSSDSIHPAGEIVSQDLFERDNFNDTVMESAAKEDQVSNVQSYTCEDKIETQASSQCVDHIDELHGESSEKSSIDFLFVDTDCLLPNKSEFSYDATEIGSEFDTADDPVTTLCSDKYVNSGERQNSRNDEEIACVLSTKDDHSKNIDLIEDNQDHNVSVHLTMPQLTLMENNSDEFRYDYELGFEVSEDKEDIIGGAEKLEFGEVHKYDDQRDEKELNRYDDTGKSCNDSGIESSIFSNGCDNKETKTKITVMPIDDEQKDAYTFEDSAICCNQTDTNTFNDIETATQDLKENICIERIENQDLSFVKNKYVGGSQNVKTENEYTASTQQNDVKAENVLVNDVTAIKATNESDVASSLSVLEMESKLDDICLDFDDELEDDALSLATSCFNSSDDERFSVNDTNLVETSSNINNENTDSRVFLGEIVEMLDEQQNVIKVESTQDCTDVQSDIFKKFKIPKISMTTATTKHSNPAVASTTAAPLPMVILPPNAFNRQPVKTESDAMKPSNFEKITRTVQNVCAVTPLTLQHPTYPNTTTAVPQCSLVTVPPLIRDMLQFSPSLIGGEVKKDAKAKGIEQVAYKRGEFAGYGGDGKNFGPPTIVVAKTFGVTCLPFLVRRCFTVASCKFSHTFRDLESVKNILMTLSEVDLNIAYKLAYNHEIIFRHYMHEFCRVFCERNNRMKLLKMVRDCERYKGGGELLITIFHCLLYCGLNKVNACRQILSHSRDRSRVTIDTLIDIIMEADWTMFCDYIEQFSDIASYHFRLKVLHQMASTILQANDQRMTSLFFKCLVNLDPKDVGLVQSSPILMQLLELIKNGQICR